MTDGLVDYWRLLAASFRDGDAGRRATERLGASLAPILEVIVAVCSEDVAVTPRDLDGERVREMLATYLPARVGGSEAWLDDVPDLLEEFLLFAIAQQPGVSPFEIVMAVGAARSAFTTACADPTRGRRRSDAPQVPFKRPGTKLGRNDPCFCGSGKKYKVCCAKLFDG